MLHAQLYLNFSSTTLDFNRGLSVQLLRLKQWRKETLLFSICSNYTQSEADVAILSSCMWQKAGNLWKDWLISIIPVTVFLDMDCWTRCLKTNSL